MLVLIKFSCRRRREHGAGAAQPTDDVGAVSSCTLPAGPQVASADARNSRKCHGRISFRPSGTALRGSRRSLLSATTTTAAAHGVVGRSSSSTEPGGITGRRGSSLEEQQHRRS